MVRDRMLKMDFFCGTLQFVFQLRFLDIHVSRISLSPAGEREEGGALRGGHESQEFRCLYYQCFLSTSLTSRSVKFSAVVWSLPVWFLSIIESIRQFQSSLKAEFVITTSSWWRIGSFNPGSAIACLLAIKSALNKNFPAVSFFFTVKRPYCFLLFRCSLFFFL